MKARSIAAGCMVWSVWLGGCAVFGTAPQGDLSVGQGKMQGFHLSGRLAVRQSSGSDSGKIEWDSRGIHQHFVIYSPLGTTVAELDRDGAGLIHLWMSDRREYTASDVESLTQGLLGYALPLDGMPWWVLGRPAPGDSVARVALGVDGHVVSLTQEGWQVSYGEWRQVGNQAVPGRLSMQHGDLILKLHVDRWVVEQGGGGKP